MALQVSDFVNVTLATPGSTLAAFNQNVLCMLTKDVPIQNYGNGAAATATVSAGAVTAFTVTTPGTGYTTPPPIFLTGGGGTGAVGQAVISGGNLTGITLVSGGQNYTSAPTVVVGQNFQLYNNAIQVGLDFGTSTETYNQAVLVFSQSPNVLSGSGYLIIYPMLSTDTLSTAITATAGQFYAGGYIWAAYQPNTAEILAASTLTQSLSPKRMLFNPTNNLSDLYSGGTAFQVQQLANTWTRNLIHTLSVVQARLMAAAYASRLMSVQMSGSNTALTMNLKQLVGIPADAGISETVAAQCQVVGADFYANVSTLSEVVSTGGNGYSDDIYNLTWLLGALQVAVFNGLASTPTKIPQTVQGMNTVVGLINGVLSQGVTNGFLAPGTWTGSVSFGNPADLIRNIADFGYYVYYSPLSQQSQASRMARQAPPIQIAVKYAGAIQSTSLTVFVQP